MLRVYSILYLEQVWSRPSEKERNPVHTSPIEELTEDESSPCSDGTFTVTSHEEEEDIRMQRSCQSSLTDKSNTDTTFLSETPLSHHGENAMFASSSSSGANDEDSSLSDVSVTEYIVHPPEKGEVIHVVFEKPEDKPEKDDKVPVIELPPTPPPPSPRSSNTFSPKRILHRAKSSITDESVKMLARRKSFFLEKFNHSNSTAETLKVDEQEVNLPDTFPMPPSPPPLKGLRRQSSRLTLKGKKLTKKLKRALSFHQDSPLHHS